MAIQPAQLSLRFTGPGSAAASFGGFGSQTVVPVGVTNCLFPMVTAAQNAAGLTEYRCIAVRNTSALTASTVKVWFSKVTAGGSSYAIGLDPIGVVAVGAQVATTIPNGTTAPSGVSFSAPTTESGGLAVASLPAAQMFAIWVRCITGPAAAALNPEQTVLTISATSPI